MAVTTRPGSIEIAAKALCPCDSGLRYGKCCKLKDFKWMKGEDGELYQVVPISPKLGRLIESTKARFKRIFGRDPFGHDPMLVEKYLLSDRDVQREMMDSMLKARISPELMYAYRKTGRLLTQKGARLLPDKDIEEWDRAIEEYRKIKASRMREPSAIVQIRSFIGELDTCIVMLGYFLEHGVDETEELQEKSGRYLSVRQYVLFCCVRCFSALQSIDWMLDNDRGVDAMPLIRAIYESYLHIRFLENHPEKLRDLLDAKLGLQAGTHSFATNAKGKPDRRTIVDNKTGEKFDGHISVSRMAEASAHASDKLLFPYMYEYLSDFVHPSVRLVHDYAAHADSLNTMHDDRLFVATCYAITAACMVLSYIKESGLASPQMTGDLKRVLARIAKKANLLLGKEVTSHSSPLDRYVLQRWEEIARANA